MTKIHKIIKKKETNTRKKYKDIIIVQKKTMVITISTHKQKQRKTRGPMVL